MSIDLFWFVCQFISVSTALIRSSCRSLSSISLRSLRARLKNSDKSEPCSSHKCDIHNAYAMHQDASGCTRTDANWLKLKKLVQIGENAYNLEKKWPEKHWENDPMVLMRNDTGEQVSHSHPSHPILFLHVSSSKLKERASNSYREIFIWCTD